MINYFNNNNLTLCTVNIINLYDHYNFFFFLSLDVEIRQCHLENVFAFIMVDLFSRLSIVLI